MRLQTPGIFSWISVARLWRSVQLDLGNTPSDQEETKPCELPSLT
jgi:hypothetical protein